MDTPKPSLREKLKRETANVQREIKKQLLTYVVASLGLVAGLAWNEAIKALIEYFYPSTQNTLQAKFAYATGVTLLIVFVSYYLAKIMQDRQPPKE
jgi:uncharacterized membrane protein YdbT with pleckstrin-like domain